jgi:hypothetical protein
VPHHLYSLATPPPHTLGGSTREPDKALTWFSKALKATEKNLIVLKNQMKELMRSLSGSLSTQQRRLKIHIECLELGMSHITFLMGTRARAGVVCGAVRAGVVCGAVGGGQWVVGGRGGSCASSFRHPSPTYAHPLSAQTLPPQVARTSSRSAAKV